MKHLGTVAIETERLILRRFRAEDAHCAFRNWMSSGRVTEYLRWKPHSDEHVTEMVLQSWISRYVEPSFYQWTIELKSIGEPVGAIGVNETDDRCELVEIGYCLGEKWWHQGIMSEALAAVIRFFFEEVGLNRVEAEHDARNVNSGLVMKKCGMTFEGMKRQADFNNTGVVDTCIYGLLREEYFARKHTSFARTDT